MYINKITLNVVSRLVSGSGMSQERMNLFLGQFHLNLDQNQLSHFSNVTLSRITQIVEQ